MSELALSSSRNEMFPKFVRRSKIPRENLSGGRKLSRRNRTNQRRNFLARTSSFAKQKFSSRTKKTLRDFCLRLKTIWLCSDESKRIQSRFIWNKVAKEVGSTRKTRTISTCFLFQAETFFVVRIWSSTENLKTNYFNFQNRFSFRSEIESIRFSSKVLPNVSSWCRAFFLKRLGISFVRQTKKSSRSNESTANSAFSPVWSVRTAELFSKLSPDLCFVVNRLKISKVESPPARDASILFFCIEKFVELFSIVLCLFCSFYVQFVFYSTNK